MAVDVRQLSGTEMWERTESWVNDFFKAAVVSKGKVRNLFIRNMGDIANLMDTIVSSLLVNLPLYKFKNPVTAWVF